MVGRSVKYAGHCIYKHGVGAKKGLKEFDAKIGRVYYAFVESLVKNIKEEIQNKVRAIQEKIEKEQKKGKEQEIQITEEEKKKIELYSKIIQTQDPFKVIDIIKNNDILKQEFSNHLKLYDDVTSKILEFEDRLHDILSNVSYYNWIFFKMRVKEDEATRAKFRYLQGLLYEVRLKCEQLLLDWIEFLYQLGIDETEIQSHYYELEEVLGDLYKIEQDHHPEVSKSVKSLIKEK